MNIARGLGCVLPLVITLNLLGCQFAVTPAARFENRLRKIATSRGVKSANEVDDSLRELLGSPPRQADLARLMAVWGRRSEEVDRSIVQFLWSSYEEPTHHSHIGMTAATWEAVEYRLRSDPEVLGQVFWYLRWMDRGVTWDNPRDKGYFVDLVGDLFGESRPDGHEAKYLLMLASMLNRPDIVTAARYADVGIRWRQTEEWLRPLAPYYVFDEDAGHYRMDEVAARTKNPVDPKRQNYTTVDTPVPPIDYPAASP